MAWQIDRQLRPVADPPETFDVTQNRVTHVCPVEEPDTPIQPQAITL
jgi:hypothetical protein